MINPDFIRSDNFNEFFSERAKLLLDIIGKAMGKNITSRSSDEIIESFGRTLE